MWLNEFLLSVLLATATATSAVSLPTDNNSTIFIKHLNFSQHTADVINLFTGILKTLSWGVIEQATIGKKQENFQGFADLQANIDLQEFEKSLAFLFGSTIATNWQIKPALQAIAKAANNVTVYEVLYERLWQELRRDVNKTNPFLYLDLYNDLQSVLTNITSDKLQRLHQAIQNDLVKCSAAVIQSYFIQNTTVWQLLEQLKLLDSLYQKTVSRVFETVNHIEDQWQIAKDLLEFDSHTPEAVFNHISYMKYLKSRDEVIPYDVYNNLEVLIARPDFVNISAEQRQLMARVLPASMGNLFAKQKICIRNTTTSFYLYECPQTYLMCTNFIVNRVNPANRKRAVFEVERIGDDQYILRSTYWLRYLHLQASNSKNLSLPVNSTAVSKITKNIYSSAESSSWFIRFHGDHATIQDSTREFYVCGGSPMHWSNMEKHAYTRQAISSYEIQQECLWLLEDCSDVAS